MSQSGLLRVGIIGASGYGGVETARLLAGHPHARLVMATASGERAGMTLEELFPSLRGTCPLVLREVEVAALAETCDFVFIALGHGKAMELVPPLLAAGLRVCDFGADFRLRDPATYAAWYKLAHTAVDALGEAVYGLPELHRERIREARLVANPGCYPTSAILPLAPFVAEDLVEHTSLIVDSASGTSGAGRSSYGPGMHHPEVSGDFKAYNVGHHRHTPEIEQGLEDARALAGRADRAEPVRVTFTPHLLPLARGILSTCYATLRQPLTAADACALLESWYGDEPFVRVAPAGHLPQLKHVQGSNFCDVGAAVDPRTNRLILISAEDNLVKGAAGQAVQNMNLMCGFPETAGLPLTPLFP